MSLPDVKVLWQKPVEFAGDSKGLEKFFRLEHWRVNVDGREDDRVVWTRGEFVLVVAFTSDEKVVAIREYKQAVKKALLCLPAGAKRKDESPKDAAIRELREETGYAPTAESSHFVFGPFFNSPDKSTEQHYVVLITKVGRDGESAPEKSETILGVQLFSLSRLIDELIIGMQDELIIGMHLMAVYVTKGFLKRFLPGDKK